jgi:hypothetical protein
MTTISANLFVANNPGVLAAGGSGLDLNGLMLTKSNRVPIGTVMSFSGPDAVQSFFGGTSAEFKFAGGGSGLGSGYFGGFDTSTIKPGALLVAQYNTAAVSAYLWGGNASAITLTQLQAFNASLTVTINGTPTTASVNLSGATSFTNAAQLIETDLAISGAAAAAFTGAITGNVLTVTSPTGSPLAVGQKITGATVAAATFISSFGTGTGGAGTYNLTTTAGAPIGAESMTSTQPAVYFDSQTSAFVINSGTTGTGSTMAFASGAMATDLLLTQPTGAYLSQGAAAATPSTFMNNLTSVTTNWVTFTHCFDPDNGSGFTNKLAFAAWNSSKNNRFMYVPFDTDVTPETQNPDPTCFSAAVNAASISGTSIQAEPLGDQNLCAFVCGAVASINLNQPGGRISMAYKKQAGLVPGVMSDTAAINLGGNPQVTGDRGNGYNYYGAIATANQNFMDYQRGFVSGPFLWIDTYINQIAMNAAMQLDMMELQEQANSIPFTSAGDGLVEAALADTIQQFTIFGAIVAGVTLSASQIARVNAQAGGLNIGPTLQNQGWYIFLTTPSSTVRQGRGPRAITFFYCDGGSIQSFSLGTVTVI